MARCLGDGPLKEKKMTCILIGYHLGGKSEAIDCGERGEMKAKLVKMTEEGCKFWRLKVVADTALIKSSHPKPKKKSKAKKES